MAYRKPAASSSEPIPERIVYGPFPRPWLDGWLIVAAFLFGVGANLLFGPEPRLSCVRDGGGGSCTLTHLYVLVPLTARTFSVEDVKRVRFDPGRWDAYTWLQLDGGEELRVDWSELHGRAEFEKIDAFFADSTERSLSPPPYPNGRTGFELAFFALFSALSFRQIFRRPSRIDIHVDGRRAVLKRRWLGVVMSTEEIDASGVTRIRVEKLARAKTRFQVFGTRPAGRVVLMNEKREVAALSEEPLLGDDVHARVARALSDRLGLQIETVVHEEVRGI